MRIYIAGPMRGYAEWNFPAFDVAAENLKRLGHTPISPASLDRALGFDPAEDEVSVEFLGHALLRDLSIIQSECDALALLTGWELSDGAQVEVALASALNIPVMYQKWGACSLEMRWVPVTIRKGFLIEGVKEI